MVVDNAGQQFTTLSWYNNGSLRAQNYYDQTNAIFVSGTDVAAAYLFKTNGIEAMRISAARGVSIGTGSDAGLNNLLVNGTISATSDERLKKDWASLATNLIEQLAEVKCGSYTRTDTNDRHIGVSAQSLESVIPEAVNTDETGFKSVVYGNAALVVCIELAKRVVALEKLIGR